MERPVAGEHWSVRGGSIRASADLLIEHLQSATYARWEMPHWNRVLVTEEENGKRASTCVALEDAEPLFRAALRRTARDWVNLHADRIEADVLYLVVEYISSSRDDYGVDVPEDCVAVNLSGPPFSWLNTLPVRTTD